MDLDTYAAWADKELAWLDSRLRREGVEALARSYRIFGEQGALEFLRLHYDQVQEFLNTPKNQRGTLVRDYPHILDRHAFLLSAAYLARCGAALLQYACKYAFSASYAPARAALLVQAASVATHLYSDFPTIWPFDDHDPMTGD